MLLQPPKYFEEKEKIIYSVAWATDNEISLTWESRHQNYSLVSICDTGAACRDSLVMTEPNGWMDLDHPPLFTKDGRQFAMILSSEGMVIRGVEFSSGGGGVQNCEEFCRKINIPKEIIGFCELV